MSNNVDFKLFSDKLVTLPLADLMQMRFIVAEEVAKREALANAAIAKGEKYAGYALSKPKSSRVIKFKKAYETIVRDHLGDKGFVTAVLPLTKVEEFIKKNFDEDDASGILGELAKTYGTKLSTPSLMYVGEES